MDRCWVETPAGDLGILYTGRGVAGLILPARPRAVRGRSSFRRRAFPFAFLGSLSRDLGRYFRGEAVAFDVPLDLRGVGDFDRRVLAVIRTIPRGEARSYGWVARRIGLSGAARAVGGACGRNPCPILIPCHRVVAAGGGLGGFSGGLAWKRYLLQLEKKEKKN